MRDHRRRTFNRRPNPSSQAYLPVFAGSLVAKPARLGKAVEVPFAALLASIDRGQGQFQAGKAQSVRVALLLSPFTPRFTASYALVHHDPPTHARFNYSPAIAFLQDICHDFSGIGAQFGSFRSPKSFRFVKFLHTRFRFLHTRTAVTRQSPSGPEDGVTGTRRRAETVPNAPLQPRIIAGKMRGYQREENAASAFCAPRRSCGVCALPIRIWRKILRAVLPILLIIALAALCQACVTEIKPVLGQSDIDLAARIAAQQKQITQAVADGKLPEQKAAKLQGNLNDIRDKLEKLKAEGRLTTKEAIALSRLLEKNGDRIKRVLKTQSK